MALKKCRECGSHVSTRAATCPSCGNPIKRKSTTVSTGCGCLLMLLFVPMCIGIFSDSSDSPRSTPNRTPTNRTPNSNRPSRSSSTPTRKWYEGGTLHNKSALEWQTASSADKLATCGDFVTKMWQNGNLKPSIASNISTVDDVRPYAQELVDFLNAGFKRDPDPEQNRKLFTNQTVSSTAVIGMVMMGWAK